VWSVPSLGLVMDSENTENNKSKRKFDTLIGSCFERLGGVWRSQRDWIGLNPSSKSVRKISVALAMKVSNPGDIRLFKVA